MRKIKVCLFSWLVVSSILLLSCNPKEDDPDFTVIDSPLPAFARDSVVTRSTDTVTRISALQLSSDYISNEVKADKDYKGRSLIVTGNILEITKGIAGNIYIVLAGANRQRTILCQFDNEEIAATFQKQQVVSLKGICDGLMGSIVMKNCGMNLK